MTRPGDRSRGRTRPTPGNHDWNTGNLNGYNGYYGSNATDAGGKSYYGYDVGDDWHVTVLDNSAQPAVGGCGVRFAPGRSGAPWSPRGPYGRQRDRASAEATTVQPGWTNLTSLQTFYEVIYAAGVDILLVGHYKVYEPISSNEVSGRLVDTTYGVRQFTVGAAVVRTTTRSGRSGPLARFATTTPSA